MKALIIDDERLARAEVRRLLDDFNWVKVVGEAENAEQALGLIETQQPDLIFLDVQMPGKSGFELIEDIRGEMPRIIFTTAYDEFALRAFEVNALDYLMKPITPDRLPLPCRESATNRPSRQTSLPCVPLIRSLFETVSAAGSFRSAKSVYWSRKVTTPGFDLRTNRR